jgi:hypothetical protein
MKKNSTSLNLKIGDSVKVKEGMMCPDLEDLCIGGWQGSISEVGEDNDANDLICIRWDSITLKNMPRYFLDQSEDAGLEYARMYTQHRHKLRFFIGRVLEQTYIESATF